MGYSVSGAGAKPDGVRRSFRSLLGVMGLRGLILKMRIPGRSRFFSGLRREQRALTSLDDYFGLSSSHFSALRTTGSRETVVIFGGPSTFMSGSMPSGYACL